MLSSIMPEMITSTKNNSRVSKIFSSYIEYAKVHRGKSQTDIANEIGLGIDKKSANFLSLIKTGRSKLPVDKIEPFLKACGIEDGSELIEAVLDEYNGQFFALLKKYKRFTYSISEASVMAAVIEAKREADESYRNENLQYAKNRNEEQKANFASKCWVIDDSKLLDLKQYIKNNLIN